LLFSFEVKNLLSICILASGLWLIDLHSVSAQSIDSAEYFFDVDPGIGNGNTIAFIPSDSISDSAVVSTMGLGSGSHNLFFRVRDTNGIWSLYEAANFYLTDTIQHAAPHSYQIISAEYFFDADPGVGNGVPLALTPSDSILDSMSVSTTGLTPGYHAVFFRVKDSINMWSLYEGSNFYLTDTMPLTAPPSFPIAAAEYFYDTDPGIGNGISITNFFPADSILLHDTLATSPLTAGVHNLFVRVRDTLNVWSLYEEQSFLICNFIPVANFKADTVCLHSPTAFTDLSTNLDTIAHYTYVWDFNNDGITDDTTKGNTTHVFQTAGTHTVSLVVNNASGCLNTIKKIIYVDSLPIVTLNFPADTICSDDTLLLNGGNPVGGTYSGVAVHSGSFYADSVSTGNHTIYYTYYNIDSCSATASHTIYVGLCTGVNEYAGENFSVTASPNPFSETTHLRITNTKRITSYELLVYNVVGEKISIEATRNSEGFAIHRSRLLQGIYFYKIISENKIVGTGKLVIID